MIGLLSLVAVAAPIAQPDTIPQPTVITLEQAIEIALKALAAVPGVLKDPAPSVSVASLDDSQVTLNIRPWSSGGDYWAVYSATCQAVKAAFEKNGVSIPFPQLTVHMDK